MKMQASKLQERILTLLNKDFDGSYDMASRLLEEMGLPKNGAPEGYTAREAGKLSDDELLTLLPTADTTAEVLTEAEVKAQEAEERKAAYADRKARDKEYRAERKAQQEEKEALAAAGYRWQLAADEDEQEYWTLVKDGKEVDYRDAMAAIGRPVPPAAEKPIPLKIGFSDEIEG